MSYDVFARYYDALTQNVNYEEMADYLCALLDKEGHKAGLTLDLACGTGSLTLALARRGLDIYGVDASMEMLSAAQEKAAEEELSILFLCQKMQTLDLYGTVNTVFCTLDSLNHLTREEDVRKTFSRVALFLEPNGYFIFDMNTLYKHQYILANQAYLYDTEDVFVPGRTILNKRRDVSPSHWISLKKEENCTREALSAFLNAPIRSKPY